MKTKHCRIRKKGGSKSLAAESARRIRDALTIIALATEVERRKARRKEVIQSQIEEIVRVLDGISEKEIV